MEELSIIIPKTAENYDAVKEILKQYAGRKVTVYIKSKPYKTGKLIPSEWHDSVQLSEEKSRTAYHFPFSMLSWIGVHEKNENVESKL